MPIYDDDISSFIRRTYSAEDAHARRAREDSPKLGLPDISINPEEGRFLQVLAAASGAGKAVEIGTLGGYSGIWIARGLAPGGKLLTIDLNPHHSRTARQHFAEAGLLDRVDTITGNAAEMLESIADRGPFDFVFIDADKETYPDYYEWAVENVRPGGLITAHNAFRGGQITAPDGGGWMMREFLERVARDDRVISTIYPAGDGTLVAVKKP